MSYVKGYIKANNPRPVWDESGNLVDLIVERSYTILDDSTAQPSRVSGIGDLRDEVSPLGPGGPLTATEKTQLVKIMGKLKAWAEAQP